MTAKIDQLEVFYAAIKRGLTVAEFLSQLDQIRVFIHSHGLTEDYRLARGRVKKLCDEVTPVARFVRMHSKTEDWISFALDDQYPDCLLCHKDGSKREIEVTIALARERFHLMKELNETGIGRGFIGIPDNAPSEQFNLAMTRDRRAYSTVEVIDSIEHAIDLCAQNKLRYRGNTLIIEADLLTLPSTRWLESLARFSKKVSALNFAEVHLTGFGNDGDICLRLK